MLSNVVTRLKQPLRQKKCGECNSSQHIVYEGREVYIMSIGENFLALWAPIKREPIDISNVTGQNIVRFKDDLCKQLIRAGPWYCPSRISIPDSSSWSAVDVTREPLIPEGCRSYPSHALVFRVWNTRSNEGLGVLLWRNMARTCSTRGENAAEYGTPDAFVCFFTVSELETCCRSPPSMFIIRVFKTLSDYEVRYWVFAKARICLLGYPT